MMLVMKFGGTSLDGPQSIEQAVDLVLAERSPNRGVVAVVSAMAGVTNALLEAARAAARGDDPTWRRALEEQSRRHWETAAKLTTDPAESELFGAFLQQVTIELADLLNSIGVLGELTTRAQDRVLSSGERLSARLMALAFRQRNARAVPVDACGGLVVTDERFGEARPVPETTRSGIREALAPLLAGTVVPVITGFIGATPNGVVTTLGRGGSDHSAALVGAALEADEVWIWSDVDGILTADPKIVGTARVLPHLSYVTAAELASCGAEVLHPRTIRPLARAGVTLRLKNTFNPTHPGTLVSAAGGSHPPAIISTNGLAMLTLQAESADRSCTVLPAALARLTAAGVDVLCFVQSSWLNGGSVLIHGADSETAMVSAAEDGLVVRVRPEVASVAVIGPGVVGPAMAALSDAGVDILATLQASTDTGLIIAVPGEQLPPLVRHLHHCLDLSGEHVQ